MATRRYHKKRVIKHSRKSRRVRGSKLIGGGDTSLLIKEIKPRPVMEDIMQLDGLIFSKKSSGIVKEIYKIEIKNGSKGKFMRWIPITGATSSIVPTVGQAAKAVTSVFGWARNKLENSVKTEKTNYVGTDIGEFKDSLERIYRKDNIKDLNTIKSAYTEIVTLNPISITFGDVDKRTDRGVDLTWCNLKTPLNQPDFESRVLYFYNSFNRE